MKSYGKDNALSVLRIVMLATMVERKMTAGRVKFLNDLATKLGLTPGHVSIVVGDYEKDVLESQTKEKGFFFGDGAFPKDLVHKVLDELTHLDLRLHAAYSMMLMLMQDGKHTAKEVAFVESCVGYWQINEPWKALVKAAEAPKVLPSRPRGGAR